MRNGNGQLIILDGPDGSGKGTQVDLLKKHFEDEGREVLFTHEPGDTPLGTTVRRLLLEQHQDDPFSVDTQFFLFWVARSEWLAKIVAPALAKGKVVISDRGDSSTYAYQVCAEQQKSLASLFFATRDKIMGSISPRYIIIDVPVDVSMERMKKDGSRQMSYFDKKPREYHEQVRQGFLEFSSAVTHAVRVDGDQPRGSVHKSILEHFALS